MSKVLFDRVDTGKILINANFKPVQEVEINNRKLLFGLKWFYFDSEQLKTRYTMADNNLYYVYILYNDVLLYGGTCNRKKESIDEIIEKFKNMTDFNEKAEKLLENAQDLTSLSEEELKQFKIKLTEKRKERQEREKLKAQERERERERKWQQYLKEKIQDFINNKYITGEVLLTLIREINYKIPIKTAGSIKALYNVRVTEDDGISYWTNKGRKLTDNMSFIIKDVYRILKDEYNK